MSEVVGIKLAFLNQRIYKYGEDFRLKRDYLGISKSKVNN